ncbi:hypothetical protein BVRB_3g068890 [Beta vulgaris subsp. vulgaris]|nr:hypothetical protein BVRB_3g068890 [Beta vulgaris subsp. vulgaris]
MAGETATSSERLSDDGLGATSSSNAAHHKPLHPVYTVSNIQHKVRVLDGTKVTYSSWVKLLQLHLRGYKVLHHVDGTPPPASTDADYTTWQEIDSHVLQWIYQSISDDLCLRILEPDTTAYAAWQALKNLFLNNKGSRAATLEHEFNTLKLESMPNLDAYCHRLKELADQLSDVDCPVTSNRLVLQLVRGLPPEFDTVASFINQQVPSFETARSMLQLEQQRKNVRENFSPAPAALVAPPSPPPDAAPWTDPPPRPPSSRAGHQNRRPNHSPRGPPRTPTARPAAPAQPRPFAAPYPPAYYPHWQPPTPYWKDLPKVRT